MFLFLFNFSHHENPEKNLKMMINLVDFSWPPEACILFRYIFDRKLALAVLYVFFLVVFVVVFVLILLFLNFYFFLLKYFTFSSGVQPYITSGKKLDGWGQKNSNFC